jgi:hypothetical protein
MLVQSQVGPVTAVTSISAGTQPPLRAGQMGDVIVSELHGRYYETSYRRALYAAANQAAQATTVALATTYTGLCLSNPAGSTVNLVLNKVGLTLTVAPAAAASLGIMTGYNSTTNVTHTTPVTPRSQFFGAGAAGIGLVDAAATLPTAPVVNTMLMGGFTAAALPSTSPALIDLEGSIILPPGAYAAIYTLTAVTGMFSFQWEEVPI